jgi:hypothetical protein
MESPVTLTSLLLAIEATFLAATASVHAAPDIVDAGVPYRPDVTQCVDDAHNVPVETGTYLPTGSAVVTESVVTAPHDGTTTADSREGSARATSPAPVQTTPFTATDACVAQAPASYRPPLRRPPPPPSMHRKQPAAKRVCTAAKLTPNVLVHEWPSPNTSHCVRYLHAPPPTFASHNAAREWYEDVAAVISMDIDNEKARRNYMQARLAHIDRLWKVNAAGRHRISTVLKTQTKWLKDELIKLDTRLREYTTIAEKYLNILRVLDQHNYEVLRPCNRPPPTNAEVRSIERTLRQRQTDQLASDAQAQVSLLRLIDSDDMCQYAT